MAGLGNVNLTLGLNTSPATQALQQYYQKLNQGAQQAARAQKPTETALGKLVDRAKKLGLEFDKTGKTFKTAFGKTKSIEEVQDQLEKLDKSLDQVRNAAQTASDAIVNGFKGASGSLLQGIGQQIGQSLVQPLLNLHNTAIDAGGAAVNAFADIDRSLRQTIAISGESTDRFDELASFLNEVGASSSFTADHRPGSRRFRC